jgi:hypothetical protein
MRFTKLGISSSVNEKPPARGGSAVSSTCSGEHFG